MAVVVEDEAEVSVGVFGAPLDRLGDVAAGGVSGVDVSEIEEAVVGDDGTGFCAASAIRGGRGDSSDFFVDEAAHIIVVVY